MVYPQTLSRGLITVRKQEALLSAGSKKYQKEGLFFCAFRDHFKEKIKQKGAIYGQATTPATFKFIPYFKIKVNRAKKWPFVGHATLRRCLLYVLFSASARREITLLLSSLLEKDTPQVTLFPLSSEATRKASL